MMTTRAFLRSAAPAIAFALMAAVLSPSPAAADKKKKEAPTRVVKGIVTDENDNPLDKAVVQLKNTRTLDVRSYYVRADGRYYFSGLDLNTDYEVRAFLDGWQEKTRRVSAFDDRMELFYQLELKPE